MWSDLRQHCGFRASRVACFLLLAAWVVVSQWSCSPAQAPSLAGEAPATQTSRSGASSLDRAVAALAGHQWDEAISAGKQVESGDSDARTALRIVAITTREMANQKRWQAMERASEALRYREAMTQFRAIEEESVYWDQAGQASDHLAARYVVEALNAFEGAGRTDCDATLQHINEFTELWQRKSSEFEEHWSRCQGVLGPLSIPASYDERIAQMNEAAKGGDYANAFRFCAKAHRQRRSDELAVKCGLLGCRAKRERYARIFHKKAKRGGRKLIREACLKSGLPDLGS